MNHPELHYEYFDLVRHNQRKHSLGLYQVIDDVFDDKWDPEMQSGAVDESAFDAVVFSVNIYLSCFYIFSTCF